MEKKFEFAMWFVVALIILIFVVSIIVGHATSYEFITDADGKINVLNIFNPFKYFN